MIKIIADQIAALAWLRCCMEQGYVFRNKNTGTIEESELAIYESFQKKLDLFDLPNIKCGATLLEKNLYEVIGAYIVHNPNPEIRKSLLSVQFMELMQGTLTKIRQKKF